MSVCPGTFITIDICLRRLEDINTVDIPATVRRIRSQRAFSIQMPDQYVFCHLAVIEHAVRSGLVKEIEPLVLDDSESESDWDVTIILICAIALWQISWPITSAEHESNLKLDYPHQDASCASWQMAELWYFEECEKDFIIIVVIVMHVLSDDKMADPSVGCEF